MSKFNVIIPATNPPVFGLFLVKRYLVVPFIFIAHEAEFSVTPNVTLLNCGFLNAIFAILKI